VPLPRPVNSVNKVYVAGKPDPAGRGRVKLEWLDVSTTRLVGDEETESAGDRVSSLTGQRTGRPETKIPGC
jgi:hypothetical protein